MRTRSRATNADKPGTSRGRANMTNPPLADIVDALVNVSVDNACMLQTLV